ncbi:hypothetical protein KAI87_06485, partial [Myxococcota bacterium]|nr:hypothetical protein [Myxococcota bacterium]
IPKCEGENGALCGLGSDCESGHCQNGFCCESGDCCSTSTDCPSSYNGDATCTDEVTCQGERFAATCNNNICAEATNASDDDSACTQQMLSDACGDAIEIYCTGEVVQNAPVCVTSLTVEHSANAKEFLVSFVPGANNGGVDGCQLQLSVDDTTWIPIAAPLFNCEQAANDIAVSLPADSWTTDWAGGVSLRMVRTDTDDVRGIASSRLSCALIDQSATATPTIDEDCNGEWDNVNVVMFPITVTESDRTYIPDMPYEVAASIDHEGSQINFASIVFLTDPLDTFLDSECTVPNAINVSTQSKVLLVAAGTVPSLNNEEYSIFSGACHPNGTINDVDVWSIFSAPWVTTVTTYANPTNWYL